MSERRGRSEDVVQSEVADLDIGESSGELPQPGLTVQVGGDEEEVDGGVGVVPGGTLQAAELQGTEVGPPTGLHQPDTPRGWALPSLL